MFATRILRFVRRQFVSLGLVLLAATLGPLSPALGGAAALQLTTTAVPAATVGTAYSFSFEASGGTPPYRWRVVESSAPPPPGLALATSGVLSGTPTTAGTYTFTVRVRNATGNTPHPTRTFSMAVGGATGSPPPPPPLTITTASLPRGAVGAAYSTALDADGGTPPYTWALASGSALPAGLSLSTAGEASGTPTTEGDVSVTFHVTDSAASAAAADATLALGIDAAGSTSGDAPAEVSDLAASPGTARGSVVLRFTAPVGSNGGPVDAYEVRSSVRLLDTLSDLTAAQVVAQSYAPSTPGVQEVMALNGLEAGQTLQFAVRAVRGGVVGPFTFATASRVTGPALDSTAPSGAVALSGSATLSTAGAYYYLTSDVTSSGTAFTITAKDVTLDLNGHKVTYATGGSAYYGVDAHSLSTTSGTTVVKNGKLVQGGGGGSSCHGANFRSVFKVRISGVEITVQGTDACGIYFDEIFGDVRVDHCTIHCNTTTVTDRHYPGVAAIWTDSLKKIVEIDHNLISSSPQWGIKVEGDVATGPALIHHNRVVGTKALVANSYMIGLHLGGTAEDDVFANYLKGESRGIHVAYPSSNSRIHENYVDVQDQDNAEYSPHWVHGIKVEGASICRVYENFVKGTADSNHAQVRALDFTCRENEVGADSHGIDVYRNRVHALATDATYEAIGINYYIGTAGVNDLAIHHNLVVATDKSVRHDWDGGGWGLTRQNVFVRDLGLGTSHPFTVESIQVGDGAGDSSTGHRVVDMITSEDPLNVKQWSGATSFSATREWTVTLRVTDGAGVAVAGATVTLKNSGGTTVATGTTDAAGIWRSTVTQATFTKQSGGTSTAKVTSVTPHSLTVTKGGLTTFTGSLTVDRYKSLTVNLGSGVATPDTTLPTMPENVNAYSVSGSALLARWAASTDAVAVPLYLVYMDGTLVGVSDSTEFRITGIDPNTSHVLEVSGLDAAGNVSSRGIAVSVTTRAEDRGP